AVVDAIPHSTTQPAPAHRYALTSGLQFVPRPLTGRATGPLPDLATVTAAIRLPALAPVVEVLGIGESRLRWRHTACDPRGVRPGAHAGWLVIRVPPGLRDISVLVGAGYDIPFGDGRSDRVL